MTFSGLKLFKTNLMDDQKILEKNERIEMKIGTLLSLRSWVINKKQIKKSFSGSWSWLLKQVIVNLCIILNVLYIVVNNNVFCDSYGYSFQVLEPLFR